MVSLIVGGYAAATSARRMNPEHIHMAVITIAVAMTATFFIHGAG